MKGKVVKSPFLRVVVAHEDGKWIEAFRVSVPENFVDEPGQFGNEIAARMADLFQTNRLSPEQVAAVYAVLAIEPLD